MPQKANHEENRSKVCVLCGSKIVFGKSKKSVFALTDKLHKLVCTYTGTTFGKNNSKYPSSICGTCRLVVLDYEKGIFNKRRSPITPNFENIVILANTRGNVNATCYCLICQTARSKSHKKSLLGRPKRLNGNIPTVKETSTKRICKTCFHQIGKGIRHKCSKKHSRENVTEIVLNLPTIQKEQVIISTLKSCVDGQCSTHHQAKELKLATGGPSATVLINPPSKIVKVPLFSENHLDNYKTNTGASLKEMETLTNFIRSCAGKKSVPSNYRLHASAKVKALSSFYKKSIYKFEINGKSSQENRPVVWADAEELVKAAVDHREIVGNAQIKVMADGGQGFMKICLTILSENRSSKLNSSDKETMEEE